MLTEKKVMAAKVEPELHELVAQVSSSRGETSSSFIRTAVLKELAKLNYLSAAQKKALGVNEREI